MTRPAPGVLAEDLRALAEVVPFDAATAAVLEAAADYLDEMPSSPLMCAVVPARAHFRCDLPPGHGGVHQQSGGPVWNDARELL